MKIVSLSVSTIACSFLTAWGHQWELLYEEDFTNPLPETNNVPWVLENYETPFDTIMDDNGM
jgi:hypothetical protein